MENTSNIKVTVIMPVYNEQSYLAVALDSVLSQTLSDIEIICIDDGSTDASLEILKEYHAKDERIRIVTENNAGPALARNNGIRRARGEFLAFLDADDFYEPTFLEKLYELAKSEKLDIAIARYDFYNNEHSKFEASSRADYSKIYEPGKVTSKSEHPDKILASSISSAWNKLYSKSFVVDNGLLFLTGVRIYEDVYFAVNSMALAQRIGKVHEVLMHHRIHSEQSRAKYFGKYYAQVPEVYLKIQEFLKQHGMYAPLSRAYLNLTTSRCYKILELLSEDDREIFWNMLHEEFATELGWFDNSDEDFETKENAEFALLIQLYTYREYTTGIKKGKKLGKNPEIIKKKNKIKGFFSKIFGKKKKK